MQTGPPERQTPTDKERKENIKQTLMKTFPLCWKASDLVFERETKDDDEEEHEDDDEEEHEEKKQEERDGGEGEGDGGGGRGGGDE